MSGGGRGAPLALALPPSLARIRDLLAERQREVEVWAAANARLIEIDVELARLTGDGRRKPKDHKVKVKVKVKDQVRAWFELNPSEVAHVNDVARILGRKPNALRSTLHRLHVDGVLHRPKPGHYQLTAAVVTMAEPNETGHA